VRIAFNRARVRNAFLPDVDELARAFEANALT